MAQGPLIILSGPSGVGKSTVIRRLLAEGEPPMRLSVSATTRARREGERDGVDYTFWTPERFQQEIDASGFLEWAEVHGQRYGTLSAQRWTAAGWPRVAAYCWTLTCRERYKCGGNVPTRPVDLSEIAVVGDVRGAVAANGTRRMKRRSLAASPRAKKRTGARPANTIFR